MDEIFLQNLKCIYLYAHLFQIIHVVRNPRDTLISYYHHCRLIEDYKGSFPQFVEMFFKGTGTIKRKSSFFAR